MEPILVTRAHWLKALSSSLHLDLANRSRVHTQYSLRSWALWIGMELIYWDGHQEREEGVAVTPWPVKYSFAGGERWGIISTMVRFFSHRSPVVGSCSHWSQDRSNSLRRWKAMCFLFTIYFYLNSLLSYVLATDWSYVCIPTMCLLYICFCTCWLLTFGPEDFILLLCCSRRNWG